jgi:hypothetical protein
MPFEEQAVADQHAQHRRALFPSRERTHQDDAGGGEEGNAERGEVTEMQFAEARPHDQHDAGKAGNHRQPSPGADLLLEDEGGKNGDAERRQENQRIGFRQRDGREGIDAEHPGSDAGPGAGLHRPGTLGVPEITPAFAVRPGEEKNKPANNVEKNPISNTVNCPPRLLTAASLHE